MPIRSLASRRATTVVLGTIAGLGLLSQYKTTPVRSQLSVGATPSTTSGVGDGGNSDETPAPTDPTSTSRLDLSSTSTTATTATTRVRTTRTTVARSTTTTSSRLRDVMGDDVQTRYGDLQLKVTFDGTRIAAISAERLPSHSQRSQQISRNAEPRLRQEALQAQSAQIDTVSGASYTSDGYRQSLQSAIDRAGN